MAGPPTVIPVDSSSGLWDRITSWASENKTIVYTAAGVAVVATGAGLVYFLNSDSVRLLSSPPRYLPGPASPGIVMRSSFFLSCFSLLPSLPPAGKHVAAPDCLFSNIANLAANQDEGLDTKAQQEGAKEKEGGRAKGRRGREVRTRRGRPRAI